MLSLSPFPFSAVKPAATLCILHHPFNCSDTFEFDGDDSESTIPKTIDGKATTDLCYPCQKHGFFNGGLASFGVRKL